MRNVTKSCDQPLRNGLSNLLRELLLCKYITIQINTPKLYEWLQMANKATSKLFSSHFHFPNIVLKFL